MFVLVHDRIASPELSRCYNAGSQAVPDEDGQWMLDRGAASLPAAPPAGDASSETDVDSGKPRKARRKKTDD